jgi:serine/threonine-protein kinase
VAAFGPFAFDRGSRLLSRDGAELPLPPRVLGVLALLLERPGTLVTKQELMTAVWRDAFVTETSLAEAISVLRQALGDDPQRPTYIQTLHRRGYRFIGEVRSDPTPARAAQAAPAAPVLSPSPEREPRLWLLVPWLTALFSLLVAAAAVWQYLGTAAPAQPVARFTLPLPPGVSLAATGAPIAVSHDGSLIALAACRDDRCAIYLRPLAQAEATPVAGTAGGASPFFSPDGRWLGFFADGRLQKIAIAGGSPVALADAAGARGAVWTRGGEIVFASASGGLAAIGAGGGPPRSLTTPSPAVCSHRWPDALPDGGAVVFTVAGAAPACEDPYAAIVSLRSGAWSRLMDGASGARSPVPGYLLARRAGDLMGVAFEPRSLSVAGLPVPVGLAAPSGDSPAYAMSASGTLVTGEPGAASVDVVLGWQRELTRLVPAAQPALPR